MVKAQPTIEVRSDQCSAVYGSSPIFMIKRDGSLWGWYEGTGRRQERANQHLKHSIGMATASHAYRNHVILTWPGVPMGRPGHGAKTLTTMGTPAALPGLDQSPWPRLVGRDWVDIKTSDDYTFVAYRKSDGSLWVSQERGQQMRMSRPGQASPTWHLRMIGPRGSTCWRCAV